MNNAETVDIYFKQVYTCKTQVYSVDCDYTIAQFYEFITAKAYSDDFGIDRNSYKIEIVEVGQFNNVNGRDAELAPALDPTSGITLRAKYGDSIKNVAFYIRPKIFINIPDLTENIHNEVMLAMAPRT
jgi:hypothetical protein